MKQILSFVLVALLIFSVSKLVFSQETKTEARGKEMESAMVGPEGATKSDTMKPQEKTKGMLPMSLLMREMMNKSIVATDDGGVVVMAGNKLMKFDKDLNLVKEVEIKMDMEGMQKMMMQMKEHHPLTGMMMHRDKMKECSTKEGAVQENEAKQEAPAAK